MVMKWDDLVASVIKHYLVGQGIVTGSLRPFKSNKKQKTEYLRAKGWNPGAQIIPLDVDLKDAIQQSREILRRMRASDPVHNYDLNRCVSLSKDQLEHITGIKDVGTHHHGHGFAAILADIIAHSVSLPTFFVAWVLVRSNVPVSPLGVAWTAEMSTLVLLGCLIHTSIRGAMKAFKAIRSELFESMKVE